MRRSDVDSTVLGDAYEYLIAKFERRKPRTPRSWRGQSILEGTGDRPRDISPGATYEEYGGYQ